MKKDVFNKRMQLLRNVRAIATRPVNYDDEYGLGLANGIILAMAILEGKDPAYLTHGDMTCSNGSETSSCSEASSSSLPF